MESTIARKSHRWYELNLSTATIHRTPAAWNTYTAPCRRYLNPPPHPKEGAIRQVLRTEPELRLDAIYAWRGRRNGQRAHAPCGLRGTHRFITFVIEHVAHETDQRVAPVRRVPQHAQVGLVVRRRE